MRKFFILAGLTVAGLFGGFQLQWSWQAGQTRAELAQSWSRDSVVFTAIGMSNRTLYAAQPGMGQAEDDAFLTSIVEDHHLANELRDLGFERIQCGGHTVIVTAPTSQENMRDKKP